MAGGRAPVGTADGRAKPAVPFGMYRIIDSRSPLYQQRLRQILVLTQFKAMSLGQAYSAGLEFERPTWRVCRRCAAAATPARQWYQGTADAIYQNIYSMNPKICVVHPAGDHIYKMNYRQ